MEQTLILKPSIPKRLAAGIFFVLLGIILLTFTLVDVGLHYLARKRLLPRIFFPGISRRP